MGALYGKRVYLVGDSWVVGAPGRALKAALQAEGAEVHINGLVGRTSRALAHDAGFARNARSLHLDVIFYLLGVNDDPDSPQLLARYTRLREIARLAHADAWVLPNTMYREPYLSRIARVTEVQRQAFEGRVVDTRGLADAADYDGSGYHLHRAGAERWVARLMPRLLAAPRNLLDSISSGLLRLVPGAQ